MASSPGWRAAAFSSPRRRLSTMMPSWSSPSPISSSAQIMPLDTWPYVLRAEIANPPGSTAPGSTHTTRSPTSKLWAPQTISWCLPSVSIWPCRPTSTVHQRIVLPFFCGSSAKSRTRATTSGPVMSPPWRSSSSRPTRTRLAATSAPPAPGARSVYSASQLSGIRMSDPHPELLREADVALDDLVHPLDPVAQLKGPLDAEPEGEPGVDVRVDAAGAQHLSVDHAGATELDPAGATAGAARLGAAPGLLAVAGEAEEVGLHARLGQREVVGTDARAGLGAEHDADERVQRTAQVGHGQAPVDGEALDLVEHGRVGGVEVVRPEHLAGGHDVDRRLLLQHRADLDG